LKAQLIKKTSLLDFAGAACKDRFQLFTIPFESKNVHEKIASSFPGHGLLGFDGVQRHCAILAQQTDSNCSAISSGWRYRRGCPNFGAIHDRLFGPNGFN
jgi:hypothetical protein